MSNEKDSNFAVVLKGETISSITGAEAGKDRIEIVTESGRKFVLYHSQSCCESVSVRNVLGDLASVTGVPVTDATEEISQENPADEVKPDYQDSFTWSTFTLVTAKGTLRIRWYGESNGYYSESVSFVEIK